MVIHVYPPNAMYYDHMVSKTSLLTKTSNWLVQEETNADAW